MTPAELLAAARKVVANSDTTATLVDKIRANFRFASEHSLSFARELVRLHGGLPWSSEPPSGYEPHFWKLKPHYKPVVRTPRQPAWVSEDRIWVIGCDGFWLGPIEPADAAVIAELRAEVERLKEENKRLQEMPDLTGGEKHELFQQVFKPLKDECDRLQAELADAKLERDRLQTDYNHLALTMAGRDKALSLLNAGMESTCEDRDRLKQRVRELEAERDESLAQLSRLKGDKPNG